MEFSRYLDELTRQRPPGGGQENLVVVELAVSTNLLARGVAVDYESEGLELAPLLVVAFEQSGGRGRQGRSWSSPRGRGVYATLALRLAAPELLQTLPLLVGVGLCRALSSHLAAGCRLKWPNDLLVETMAGSGPSPRWRKIGGILIEALVRPGSSTVALIGFGVNHGQRRDELPSAATSLRLLDSRSTPLAGHPAETKLVRAPGEGASPSPPEGWEGDRGVAGGDPIDASSRPPPPRRSAFHRSGSAPPVGPELAENTEQAGDAPGPPRAGGGPSDPWPGPPTLADLTWELVGGVERELTHLGDSAYAVAAYRGFSIHRPGERMTLQVGAQLYEGTFAGFDEHGLLRLDQDGREQLLSAGELIEPS
ncbi:MAG TPA: biotin--[acetyl-CoA-carboxylase] ligase [Thermoanaerobaculia bacterium]|nr:biotin--[acetyl-CoA-carboxylase] ligase [Thermoanaerobaculia bacterium]